MSVLFSHVDLNIFKMVVFLFFHQFMIFVCYYQCSATIIFPAQRVFRVIARCPASICLDLIQAST